MKQQPREQYVHAQLAQYVRTKYPDVIFRTDYAAGMRLTPGQAVRHASLQSGRAYPDFFIAKPSQGFCGLFIEIKRAGTRIYTRKGQLVSNKHILEQYGVLSQLWHLGYQARFGCGLEECMRIVDEYLGSIRTT